MADGSSSEVVITKLIDKLGFIFIKSRWKRNNWLKKEPTIGILNQRLKFHIIKTKINRRLIISVLFKSKGKAGIRSDNCFRVEGIVSSVLTTRVEGADIAGEI